eukprot:jgi/Psemu1/5685/gm1.5685_g
MDGDPIMKESTERPYSPTKQGQVHAIVGEETVKEEVKFEDKLDQDCYYSAYQFTQTTIAPTYIEDMRGNAKYCLNMKHGYEIKLSKSKLQKELTYGSNQMDLNCKKHFGLKKSNTMFGERMINTKDQEDVPTTQELMVSMNNGEIETVEKRSQISSNEMYCELKRSDNSNMWLTIQKDTTVELPQMIVLPESIEEHYQNMIIAADVLHVNRLLMLATILRNNHYGTIIALPSTRLKVMEEALKSVFRSNVLQGCQINRNNNDQLSDNEDDEFIPEVQGCDVALEEDSDEENDATNQDSSKSEEEENESGKGSNGSDTGSDPETSDNGDEATEVDEATENEEITGMEEPDIVGENKVHHLEHNESPNKIQKVIRTKYENFVHAIEYIKIVQQDHNLINHYVMTQMSTQEGMRVHGEEGKASIMKEIDNLVTRGCFGKVNCNLLTEQQKHQALPILMFMLIKQDGRLKSRGCADRRPQHLWTNKQDNASPTPVIEDVASFDLPGLFLQTSMDEPLHLKINGALALLLAEYGDKHWKRHL